MLCADEDAVLDRASEGSASLMAALCKVPRLFAYCLRHQCILSSRMQDDHMEIAVPHIAMPFKIHPVLAVLEAHACFW